MSGMINVDGSDDPSYRYKMPRLISKVEGRGNGVKTVLVNCVDVAQALHRSPGQVTKFFGCELGAMTKYEDKIERSLVNGSFDNKMLQEALTGYIQKFVLCPSCNNPETVQELKGKKKAAIVLLNCKACGATEPADNTHKLVTFIVKEMSPEEAVSKKEKRKEKKKEKNSNRSATGSDGMENVKKRNSSGSVDESVSTGERDDKETKVKKKKKKHKDREDKEKKEKKVKRSKEKVKEKENEVKVVNESNGDDSSSNSDFENDVDHSVNGLANGFANGIKLTAVSIQDVAAIEAAADLIFAFMKGSPSTTVEAIYSKAVELTTNTGMRKQDLLPVLFYAVVNTALPVTQILERVNIFGKATGSFKSTQDFEYELLLCFEEVLAREVDLTKRTQLCKIMPLVLKQLYDEDYLEEATINAWFEGKIDGEKFKHERVAVSTSDVAQVKAAVRVIIDWLKQAESGSDEDDESEE